MSLGKGATYASSERQRINTKSLTEVELVYITYILPQICSNSNEHCSNESSERAIIFGTHLNENLFFH